MPSPPPAPGLLATDLDRTLLPNGEQPESPGARSALTDLVRRKGLRLAFVTGRRLSLVQDAIAEYELPAPDWILADVGSTLYERDGTAWRPSDAWADHLATDWPDRNGPALARFFTDVGELVPQEDDAQGPFKLSFHAPPDLDAEMLCMDMERRLDAAGLPSVVVHSIDEALDLALVDVLPRKSSKRGALEFLIARGGFALEDVLFAGDSGNDREVLTSPIPSVLVANADDELRTRVREEAAALGTAAALHFARGGVLGMNGNYAAGILEGWLHFHPGDLDSPGPIS